MVSKSEGPTRKTLNEFHEAIAVAKESFNGLDMPVVEAPREIVEYFNRSNLKGFDEAKYFVFNGVKVCETGTRDTFEDKDKRTIEDINFGKK